jgi:methylated-DNA-[protein]-cysteine S-methyltransferase
VTGPKHAPRYRVIETPTGAFHLVVGPEGSVRTGWAGFGTPLPPHATETPNLLPELADRLQRKFQGEQVRFDDVPIAEGPPFHRACWKAARSIPSGTCLSYAELARRAGSPRGARAAGQAMRHNPQPVITPCHRVIGSGGRMGGFSGSTERGCPKLRTKTLLLELEGARLPRG